MPYLVATDTAPGASRSAEVRVPRSGESIPSYLACVVVHLERTATCCTTWLLDHTPAVLHSRVRRRAQHLPRVAKIPVIKTDRGGQVTYHGPGQVVIYLLLNLRRRGIPVRPLVRMMEQAVIDLLADYGVAAEGRNEAPGVYVGDAKIAALGLRIKSGCCYHGLRLQR